MKYSKKSLMFFTVLFCCILGWQATAQESDRLKWRGYFGWNFQNDTKQGSNSAFDAFALSLIPKFTLSDKVDVYGQIVFEHAPFHDVSSSRRFDARSAGEIVLNDSYLTYTFNGLVKFRVGKFATPFGFWNTLQYAGPAYVTVKQPGRDSFYSRGSTPDTNSNMNGRYSQGAWILGEKGRFGYDLYVSNGKTSSRPHIDDSENKALGGRLKLGFPVSSTNIKLIYSRYQDKFKVQSINSSTFVVSTSANFIDQSTNALSAEFTGYNLSVISEIAESKKDIVKMNALYIMTKYDLSEKWTPFLQYQSNEPNKDVSNDKTNYYTYGCAYQILPWQTMLKLQADYVKRENTEGYYRWILGLASVL